jgi:hypothetical protein
MQQSTVRKIFNEVYNGQGNFMTPTPVRYGAISKDCIYEISKGQGIRGDVIYGLTFLERNTGGEWVTGNHTKEWGGCWKGLTEVNNQLDALMEYYWESRVS